jgi:uncharacterized protein
MQCSMTPTLTDIPHEDFVADVRMLAGLVAADGWTPDYVVGVGRGGLVPGTFLSHALGRPMLSVDHSARQPDFADGLLVRLAERTRNGERLLIVDDINDTGGTIAALRTALAAAGSVPDRVRFAVLIDNVRSTQRVAYAARTIDRDVQKDWFVFPWEAVAPREAIVEDAVAVPERTA